MKEKIVKYLKWFFASYIWLGLILLIADIVSKNVIVQNASKIHGGQGGGVDIIPGFLGINYTINNKFVFGWDIFKNDAATRIVFVVISLTISAALIVFLIKKWDKINKFYKACIMMIIAGAIGNSIDRIFYSVEYLNYYSESAERYISGVVDWIDFYGVWGFNFNIADSAVVVAAIMLIVYMIVVDIIEAVKKNKQAPKEVDNTKVLSKTEQEQNQYLEKKEEDNE